MAERYEKVQLRRQRQPRQRRVHAHSAENVVYFSKWIGSLSDHLPPMRRQVIPAIRASSPGSMTQSNARPL